MNDLDLLWQLTGEDRLTYGREWNQFFDAIGLILLSKLEHWEDGGSPANALTFAVTGGDSVHYSFLRQQGKPDDQCPVVMTLPAAEGRNFILAENLREFLGLGCRNGYFTLEQLEYDPDDQIAFLDSQAYDPDREDEELKLLQLIETRFAVRPPTNVAARLQQLAQKYGYLPP